MGRMCARLDMVGLERAGITLSRQCGQSGSGSSSSPGCDASCGGAKLPGHFVLAVTSSRLARRAMQVMRIRPGWAGVRRRYGARVRRPMTSSERHVLPFPSIEVGRVHFSAPARRRAAPFSRVLFGCARNRAAAGASESVEVVLSCGHLSGTNSDSLKNISGCP